MGLGRMAFLAQLALPGQVVPRTAFGKELGTLLPEWGILTQHFIGLVYMIITLHRLSVYDYNVS